MKSEVKTKKIDQASFKARPRVGYVFPDKAKRDQTPDWNWSATDPKNRKVVAEGHGFNTKAGAVAAMKREIPGLYEIRFDRPTVDRA